jgi:hypothetical protein
MEFKSHACAVSVILNYTSDAGYLIFILILDPLSGKKFMPVALDLNHLSTLLNCLYFYERYGE